MSSPTQITVPAPAIVGPFFVALYDNKFSKKPAQVSITWATFVRFILDYVEESPCTVATCIGGECPHKAFSTLPDNPMAWSPTEITGKRLDINVKSLSLLVLDFDHLDLAAAAAVEEALASYERVRHTTHNNREEDLAFREVLVLSRSVHANQWHRFLAAAVSYLGVSVTDRKGKRQPDPTCKNRSRYYYRPSHPKDAPHDAGHVGGKVLDVDEVLRWGEINLPASQQLLDDDSTLMPEVQDWDLDGSAVQNAIDCIARFFPDVRRHDLALALGGMLRRHGASEEDAHYIIHESFKVGGSQNPKERAKTVTHTYSLPAESAMTGFTRVAEILGEDEAEELGEYLTSARNEAFLRSVAGQKAAAATSGVAQLSVQAPAPPADLAELRRLATNLARARAGSEEREDHIAAVLIRRVLDGRPIARPAGQGDVETRKENEERGIGRDKAIRKVASSLAYAFPQGTSWSAVSEVMRLSLANTYAEPGVSWEALAERIFKNAQETRKVDDLKRQMAEEQRLAQNRSAEAQRVAASAGRVPAKPASALVDPNWLDKLSKNAQGTYAPTTNNISMILECDPQIRGMVVWNEHHKRIEILGGTLADFFRCEPEDMVTELQDYFERCYGISVKYIDLERRFTKMARANSHDPLADRFLSLSWDGVPRFDRFLITYFGAEDTPHNRRIGRCWMLGAMARALPPSTWGDADSELGAKFDNVLIFEHLQGGRKSSAFEALGGGFFASTDVDTKDKDAKMLAACSWLVELAELASLRRGTDDQLKNFLTQRTDKFRAPFARAMKDYRRRCVFVGTTNEGQYLSDPTGNRRYWPVACGNIDIPGLLRDCDQLWAEAVHVFLQEANCPACAVSKDTVRGQRPRCEAHRWWLSPDEEREAARHADARVETLPWMSWRAKIMSWWRDMKDRPTSITVEQIATYAGEVPVERHSRGMLTTIGVALSKMGWIRKPSEGTWLPSAALLAEPHVPRRGLMLIPGGKS